MRHSLTTQGGCPPHQDDVLLGTLSGVASQGVTHCPLPLFGWQAAKQVKTGVYVGCWVQLKDTETQSDLTGNTLFDMVVLLL